MRERRWLRRLIAMARARIKLNNRGKEPSDKKIREIGHKHFAEDFPNPERRGCPPISEIMLLADKPLEGKDWVLDHIGFCSPCYGNFGYFLHARRKKFRARSGRNP
jgi:hypothetical protein